MILVFTTDSEDWSYCMWECGVATDPRDKHQTSVVVFQCTDNEPKPYADQLRVDGRNLDSVHGFVKSLLTTTDIFSNRDEPVTGFAAEGLEISQFAAQLHADLEKVLPAGSGTEKSTPASPYICVHVDGAAANELRTHYLEGTTEQCLDLLEHQATIVSGALGAESLFGMGLAEGTTLGEMSASWRQDNPAEAEPRWFSSLAEQMVAALGHKVRPVKWAPLRTTLGRADVPYVAATRSTATGVHFDIYLVPFAPRPVLVKDKMLTVDQMYFKDEAAVPLTGVLLMALVNEMDERKATRLPVLRNGSPVSIIHKATINEFLVQAIASGHVSELTLQDLLDKHAEDLEGSYTEVAPEATVEEAIEAMSAVPGCQDVFVTKDARVVGWLTNVMFVQDTQS